MKRDIYVPPGGPPRVARPNPRIYALMGRENIFRMLEDFYLELGKSPIAHLFPRDLIPASRKSAAFFVGLLGGPPLYQQEYGNPMMRARHMAFVIDERARQEWLDCFYRILEDAPDRYGFPPEHMDGFRAFLDGFSAWMVNSGPGDEDPQLGLSGPPGLGNHSSGVT